MGRRSTQVIGSKAPWSETFYMRKELAVRKSVFPLVLIAFPFFLSTDLDEFSPTFDTALNIWKILSFLAVSFLYVKTVIRERRISVHALLFALLATTLLISTLINSGSLNRFFVVWAGFFAVCLLVESTIKKYPVELMLALKIVLSFLVITNLASVVIFPEGLWATQSESFWLFGHRNNFGPPLIAAVVVCAAFDLNYYRRLSLSTLTVSAAALLSVSLTWSASAVATVVLTLVMLLLVVVFKNLKMPNPFWLLALYAVINLCIVVFRVQEHFAGVIEAVLNRTADLTGRTRIWDIVFTMIGESPLLGKGVQPSDSNGLTEVNEHFVHAHNGSLDILMQGGFVSFALFAALLIFVARSANRFRQFKFVQVLYLGLLIEMIRAIAGLHLSSYFLLLVFLLLNLKSLVPDSIESAVENNGEGVATKSLPVSRKSDSS